MRVVALISGGKDSCFNMMQCVAAGHEIVALANLQPGPSGSDELDSYMYQTVGHDGISLYSESMGLPLFRRVTAGKAVVQDKEYLPTDGDEVEDLFGLLSDIKKEIEFDGIAVGAILSDYQRIRVENVCTRIGCVCLAYLWRRDQSELLKEMIDSGINAIIIKTACLGLDPDVHLGQSIAEMYTHLLESKEKYGINVCGEGGEYETFTLDCPMFNKPIVLDEYEKVIHSNDAFAPVGYLKLKKLHLVTRNGGLNELEPVSEDIILETSDLNLTTVSCKPLKPLRLNGLPVKSPLDYVSDLIECTKADCCDGHVELCTGGSGDDPTVNNHQHCTHHQSQANNAPIAPIAPKCPDNDNSDSGPATSPSKIVDTAEIADIGDKEPESVCGHSSTPLTSNNYNVESLEKPTDKPVENSLCQRNVRETSYPTDSLRVTGNNGGWVWVMGIQGRSNSDPNSTSNPMAEALTSLKQVLEERNMTLKDVIGVCMYISDLEEYLKYNKEYIKFFSSQPPIRVCVEAPLPQTTPILMEALAYSVQPESDNFNLRQCMHVQGISHWAPANIGPYSQAIWVGDIIYVAGQIGLVPGSMTIVPGDAKMECKLALRSLNRIIKATDSKVELRDVVQGICFVTESRYIEDCRGEWEKRTNNAIVEYLVVPRLPREAKVEWQIWAHKHNTAFEYEETGCYVGSGVKIKIIRRWNYENRVSAIVCRASITTEEAKFGPQEMQDMTEYALTKLLRDAEKSTECSLRVFYRTGAVDPELVFKTLETECSKYSIAFSILPVCSLVMETSVISFCGVRH